MMTVLIASDHAGLELKAKITSYLKEQGLVISDLGPFSNESVDYPDFARLLAETMKHDENAKGILICGSGIGMSIAVNRFPHIRAALVNEPLSSKLAREHNNANVLCLGERLIGITMAKECINVFLKTPFEGGRHQVRIDKLTSAGV